MKIRAALLSLIILGLLGSCYSKTTEYCNIRLVNQTGAPITNVSITNVSKENDSGSTAYPDLETGQTSGYMKVFCGTDIPATLDGGLIYIVKSTLSYQQSGDINRVLYDMSVDPHYSYYTPNARYTVTIQSGGATVQQN
jgi:hypothetical protein